jgi:hypothetical protein
MDVSLYPINSFYIIRALTGQKIFTAARTRDTMREGSSGNARRALQREPDPKGRARKNGINT